MPKHQFKHTINIRFTETDRIESSKWPEHIDIGKDFLKRTPMVQVLRSRINKWDLMEMKSFCKSKDTVVECQPVEWEKIFFLPIPHITEV